MMKRFTIIAFIVVCVPMYALGGFGSSVNDRVKYYVNTYRIDDKKEQEFLQKIVHSKDATAFLKDHNKIINTASKNLLEAAYWLANEQKKMELANRLLEIIESK